MTSPVMNILEICENELGWVVAGVGADRIRTRATMHKILRTAMTKQGISEEDMLLTVAYCKRRRLPIDSPIQLLGLTAAARAVAAVPETSSDLLDEAGAAIWWENELLDKDSYYWVQRLVNATGGPGIRDVLGEWRAAGRG